ncbi:hypothetical protein M378DRAFT_310728 [Amanita muscaria Koide BX008]|uniref:Uncharacterized protein n=1 Tax=Amanita muscaria (strain Koide BX008) TaxID=946122 RepID=A0A0C2SWY1_AMAMK|nr:hypothetical protein M378DRAFT_310728 [Amanita muscaria Koide BX008]
MYIDYVKVVISSCTKLNDEFFRSAHPPVNWSLLVQTWIILPPFATNLTGSCNHLLLCGNCATSVLLAASRSVCFVSGTDRINCILLASPKIWASFSSTVFQDSGLLEMTSSVQPQSLVSRASTPSLSSEKVCPGVLNVSSSWQRNSTERLLAATKR